MPHYKRLLGLEAGKLKWGKGPTDFDGIVDSGITAYEEASRKRELKIQPSPFEEALDVIADPQALREVVENLISNTIKS